MDIKGLIGNIIEQIKEAQLKLGFAKEAIRLYYPPEELCSLLRIPWDSESEPDGEQLREEELTALLNGEAALTDTELGKICFSLCRDGRIEVRISPDGAAYVHENIPDPPFLTSIIELFREKHDLTIEEICACFAQFGNHYVCERMEPEAEFDYALHFAGGKPDPWYYCVKMEMGHTIYHRFREEDYRRLLA